MQGASGSVVRETGHTLFPIVSSLLQSGRSSAKYWTVACQLHMAVWLQIRFLKMMQKLYIYIYYNFSRPVQHGLTIGA